ncbi:MAG TPA: SUMF1/EgtB/PvdO family nonheme iron enzyme, partial [Anaeromyxobacteraceae bacterium]
AAELPRLQALVAADDCVKAFDLVLRLEPQLPGDPQVRALAEACSSPVRLQTDPPGARVSFRPYDADDSAFRPLGRTPLRDVRVPHGVGVFRFELVGRATVLRVLRNPGLGLGNVHDPFQLQQAGGTDLTVPLPAEGEVPPAMVLVPATRSSVSFVSDAPVAIPPYLLGRFEVTNREFKEFVDAGGYRMERLWRDLPFGAAVTSWHEAVARFVDSTGRPGPSTWESGFYPDGAGDHPVAGVSWFEATAYARFRGLELPTAYHWYRAAFSLDEITESISAAVARRGNFQGRGTEPVGQRADVGPYGTSGMAGNVREWLSTARGAMRMIAGGAFNQGPYLYYTPDAADPWDRSPGNGLRLMRTADGAPVAEVLRGPVDDEEQKLGDLRPVEDAAWAVLEHQLVRSVAPLDARQEAVAPGAGAWRRETVSLATGYDEGRFRLQLFLPIGRPPPWQVVVLLPHAGYFRVPQESAAFDPSATSQRLDFLMKAGRALVLVVFDGMFERRWPDARRAATSQGDRYRILLHHHGEEIGRALDYLQGRKDFDAARAGVLGFSYGAQAMMSLLAVEPRLGPAVLIGGGVFFLPGLPVTEQPFNYYPRVRQPVLMLSGRWDIDVAPAAQEAMLRLLGSPEEQKKRVVFDVGHGWVPQNQFVREALEWYDRYLGPVR